MKIVLVIVIVAEVVGVGVVFNHHEKEKGLKEGGEEGSG